MATVAHRQFTQTRFGLGRERVPVGGDGLTGLLGNQVGVDLGCRGSTRRRGGIDLGGWNE